MSDRIIGFTGNGVICLYIYHKLAVGCQRLFQKLDVPSGPGHTLRANVDR